MPLLYDYKGPVWTNRKIHSYCCFGQEPKMKHPMTKPSNKKSPLTSSLCSSKLQVFIDFGFNYQERYLDAWCIACAIPKWALVSWCITCDQASVTGCICDTRYIIAVIIWMFPKIVVPQIINFISILIGFSIMTIHFGVPLFFLETPVCYYGIQ